MHCFSFHHCCGSARPATFVDVMSVSAIIPAASACCQQFITGQTWSRGPQPLRRHVTGGPMHSSVRTVDTKVKCFKQVSSLPLTHLVVATSMCAMWLSPICFAFCSLSSDVIVTTHIPSSTARRDTNNMSGCLQNIVRVFIVPPQLNTYHKDPHDAWIT